MSGCWFGCAALGVAIAMMASSFAPVPLTMQDPHATPPKNPIRPSGSGLSSDLGGAKKTGDQLVKVTATANTQEVSPGETFYLAFLFEIEPHWHIYWKNSGSSGAPTEIKMNAPAGFVVGKTLFPRPTAFAEEDGATFGYQDKVALFVEVTAPIDLPSGSVMFNAKVNWLVCKDVCLMGRSSQVVTLNTKPGSSGGKLGAPPKGSSASGSATTISATFQDPFVQKCFHRIPEAMSNQADAKLSFDKQSLVIKLPAQGLREAEFFPVDCPGVTFGEARVSGSGEHLVLTVPININPQNSQGKPPVAAGMIGLGKGLDDPCFEFEHPLSTP